MVENGRVWRKGEGREVGERMRQEERGGTARVGSHPMSEILKNTLIAELI